MGQRDFRQTVLSYLTNCKHSSEGKNGDEFIEHPEFPFATREKPSLAIQILHEEGEETIAQNASLTRHWCSPVPLFP